MSCVQYSGKRVSQLSLEAHMCQVPTWPREKNVLFCAFAPEEAAPGGTRAMAVLYTAIVFCFIPSLFLCNNHLLPAGLTLLMRLTFPIHTNLQSEGQHVLYRSVRPLPRRSQIGIRQYADLQVSPETPAFRRHAPPEQRPGSGGYTRVPATAILPVPTTWRPHRRCCQRRSVSTILL